MQLVVCNDERKIKLIFLIQTHHTGVVRSMHCNPDFPADVLPVDTAINAIICAAWERGMNETKKIQYCNITLPHEKQLTWGESVERGKCK